MTRSRPARRTRQAGVSMVEVLVAMTLFALVASGMAALAAGSLRATANNRASSAAMMIGQSTMEALRAAEYDAITGGSTTVSMSGESFGVLTQVTSDDPGEGLKRVHVTVSWSGTFGPRTYELESIFTAVH